MLAEFLTLAGRALKAPAFIRNYRTRTREGLFMADPEVVQRDYLRILSEPFEGRHKALVKQFGRMHTYWKFAHFHGGDLLWAQGWTPNALTDQGEADILDVYFINASAPATNFWFLLGNAPASGSLADTDTLSTITELAVANGYARQQVDRAITTGWTRSVSTMTSTTETFSCSGSSWSTANWLGLTDVTSGTSGVLIATVGLSLARTLANTDTLQCSMAVSLD